MSDASTIPTPATPDVCSIGVLIDGKEVSGEFHVLSVVGDPTSSTGFRRPRSRSQDGEAAKATFAVSDTDHFVPGKKIEIQLGYRSQNETVFKGIDRQAPHQGAQERQRC